MASKDSYWDSMDSDSEEPSRQSPKQVPLRLSDQIVEKYETSKFDPEEKHFLPAGYVEQLVTLEAIIKELDEKDYLESEYLDSFLRLPENNNKKKVVDSVYKKAKTVFAITVVSGLRGQHLGKTMHHFMKLKFSDDSLPVTETLLNDHIQPLVNRLGDSSGWSKTRRHTFLQEQWRFIAPVFSQKNFKVDLKPNHILPFIAKSSSGKEGAFGQVYMVEIHPAHHKDPVKNLDGSLAKLAIKEFIIPANDEKLQKDAEDVWKSEVDTLDEISDLSHPHIIQRIAAITRGRQRCLMFLWADGGNLRDFWIENPKPILTAALVKNIIEQLRGMAEALQKLHGYRDQYHYRHGDLKPENILNFPDPDKSRIGTFKISDLGSAKHHSVATRLRERTGGKAFATTVYQPPESITNKLSPSSRLYDIWSMGCVTLEFMVWVLYGYEELKKFTTGIKGKLEEPCSFFEVQETEQEGTTPRLVARLHPTVQAYLDRLSRDPECTGKTALGDLLEVIKTKLLVIKLPEHTESSLVLDNVSVTSTNNKFTKPQAFQPFGKHRTSAVGFVNALDDILNDENAKKESYWFTGHSRENLPLIRIVPEIITEESSPSSLLSPGWLHRRQPSSMADRTKTAAPPNSPATLMVAPGPSQKVRTGQETR